MLWKEMTEDRRKKVRWLCVNLGLVLCESWLCFTLLFRSGKGFDPGYLLRYPDWANFCLFLSSWILVAACIAELRSGREKSFYAFRLFRYMTVTASSVTAIVAVLVFLPFNGFDFRPYLESVNLLECIVCPSLAYFSFTRFGDYSDFGKRETVFVTVCGLLYNALIVILNRTGVIEGPYSFQKTDDIGTTVFWSAVIIIGTFIVASAILIVAQAHGPVVKKSRKLKNSRNAVRSLEKIVDDEAEKGE